MGAACIGHRLPDVRRVLSSNTAPCVEINRDDKIRELCVPLSRRTEGPGLRDSILRYCSPARRPNRSVERSLPASWPGYDSAGPPGLPLYLRTEAVHTYLFHRAAARHFPSESPFITSAAIEPATG